ncbi:MAG: hypothetical protein WCV83_01880 [Candidatus Magasanikbacteria bacterium]
MNNLKIFKSKLILLLLIVVGVLMLTIWIWMKHPIKYIRNKVETRSVLISYANAIKIEPFKYPSDVLCDVERADDEQRFYTDFGEIGRDSIAKMMLEMKFVRFSSNPSTFVFRFDSSDPPGWFEISVIQKDERWCIRENWSS